MTSAILFAHRALDDLSSARMALDGLHRSDDATCDEAVIRWDRAHSRAIQAMREAIPGPDSPGEFGRRHKGSRALFVPGPDGLPGQLFVLVERDVTADIQEAAIVVVPLGAIEGLTSVGP